MRISLAPMEGVVDHIIRELYSRIGGYDHFVTEFVRVTQGVYPKHVFFRYCPELHNGGRTISGTPVYIQLLGGDPELMALNAKAAVEAGALGIDINFGCPAKTVNRHDGGATLLKNPHRLYDVITAIKCALPPNTPVTAKVRLGFDNKDLVLDIARAVDEAGAGTLTVHARTKVEGYKPPAHWEFIAKMCDVVKRVPVIANGDIWTVDDYYRCKKITGCENVALGRPAMATPDLARQIKASVSSDTVAPLKWSEIESLWLPQFIEKCIHHKGDQFATGRTKQWTKLMSRQYPEAQEFFTRIKRCKSISSLANLSHDQPTLCSQIL